MATSSRIKLKSSQTALLNIKSLQNSNGLHCHQISIQALLGHAGMRDSHHGCVTTNLQQLSYQYGPKLWRMFPAPCWVCATKNWGSFEGKRGPTLYKKVACVCTFCRYWCNAKAVYLVWCYATNLECHLIAPAAIFHILTEPLKHTFPKRGFSVHSEGETVEHNVSLGWIGYDACLILFITPGEMQQK